VRIGFDVPLSRRLYAAGDALLMPSRFEPCGLNQMYAMRYGTVPVVRAVGGLRDTVIDADVEPARATGFSFSTASAVSLHAAMGRAARLRRRQPDRWAAMIDRGMARDGSWDASARAYLALYRALCD
jgi:starch synthase